MAKTTFVHALCVLLLVMCGAVSVYGADIRVRAPQSPEDATHGYFVSLLQMALDKTALEYGPATVRVTSFNVPQGRALAELARGTSARIDVDWSGTGPGREHELLPVRIPLLGGLLGYRVPVIRRAMTDEFMAIRNVRDLRRYTAVQGTHWPDSDCLEHAGIVVERVALFELMYPMLKAGRVDFFPRGITEAYAEVAQAGSDTLVVFDSLLIHYPLPMYFFTSRTRQALAGRLEEGLRVAIVDGSFSRLIRSHPATASLFPLSRFTGARVIQLKNPQLPLHNSSGEKGVWFSVGGAVRPH